MSYFSDKEYRPKYSQEELWFDRLYFNRWFKDTKGQILDIGCATGNFIALAPNQISGVDIDDDSIAIARSRGFNVDKIEPGKPMSILKDEAYEGIYIKHVVEHLSDPLLFFKEVNRILKFEGKAIILTPNCPYMLNRAFWDDYTHKHPFTKKSLSMVAYDAGFKNILVCEDFRCFPGLGKIMRVMDITPSTVSKIQRFFGIRGLSLVLEIKK